MNDVQTSPQTYYQKNGVYTDSTKVLLGLPCGWKDIPATTFDCILNLDFTEGSEFARRDGPSVASMRNKLAQEALHRGFSHVLMLDADMVYPSNTLIRLLQADVDVICGMSVMRTSPHYPLFNTPNPNGDPLDFNGCWPTIDGRSDGELLMGGPVQQVHSVGGAAMLIRCTVFEKLGAEGDYFSHAGMLEDGRPSYGEDIWFANECHKIGINHYMDTGLMIGHQTNSVVYPDYDRENKKWITRYATQGRDGLTLKTPQQVKGNEQTRPSETLDSLLKNNAAAEAHPLGGGR